MGISAITLLEIAILSRDGPLRMKLSMDDVFAELEASPVFRILPLTIEIAKEVFALGAALRDPADRVIVATARVYGMRLLTSDRRIIESNIVSAVE